MWMEIVRLRQKNETLRKWIVIGVDVDAVVVVIAAVASIIIITLISSTSGTVFVCNDKSQGWAHSPCAFSSLMLLIVIRFSLQFLFVCRCSAPMRALYVQPASRILTERVCVSQQSIYKSGNPLKCIFIPYKNTIAHIRKHKYFICVQHAKILVTKTVM